MVDVQNPSQPELGLRVQQSIRREMEQRDPLAGAYIVVLGVTALCGFTLYVEWANISLALASLFPTLSNGGGFGEVTRTLAFASVAAILLAERLMDKASAHWSPRTRRMVDLIGIASLVLFVVAAMVLLPTSVGQANDPSDAVDGAMSQGANFAFALMLAALFPVSLLANFALFERLKPALAKIQRSKLIDGRVRAKRGLLKRYDATRASIRSAQAETDTLPDAAQMADEYAAAADAVIGQVRGQLGEIIVARETAAASSEEKPFVATDDQLFNHQPMEKLRAQYDYLKSFTPASIRRTITTRKEA